MINFLHIINLWIIVYLLSDNRVAADVERTINNTATGMQVALQEVQDLQGFLSTLHDLQQSYDGVSNNLCKCIQTDDV